MKFLGTIDEAKDIINKEFIDSLLGNYQPLITSTNKLSYSLISGVPTSLKNPYALTFGSKSYDGSGAITITASDLGALTSHQSIYNLTMQAGEFTAVTFAPNGAAKTVNIPTTTAHISEDGNLYFTNERAISALSETLSAYVSLNGTQEISGEKNFTGGLKVNSGLIHYDSTNGYWKLDGDLIVTGGISMYSSDTEFTPSTIMDALSVDNTNLKVVDGVLTFVGPTGGATTLGGLSNVDSSVDDGITGLLFNQNGTWISADNTTIRSYLGIVNTLGSLTNVGSWADSVASQDRIMYQAANSSQWVAKNLSDLAVGGVTGDYLPLSGGKLTGTLEIDSSTANTSTVFGTDYDGSLYYAYFDLIVGGTWKNNLVLYSDGNAKIKGNTIWHAGNDGSGSGLNADMLDGYHEWQFYREARGIIASADLNTYTTRRSGSYGVNYTNYYGALFVLGNANNGSTSALEIFAPDYQITNSPRIRYSVDTNRYTAWRILAFEDSNVASTTKLQTARTIWGQSFNGTENVDGPLLTANNNFFLSADGGNTQLLGYSQKDGYYSLGYSAGVNGITTHIYGGEVDIYGGTTKVISVGSNGLVGFYTKNQWLSPSKIMIGRANTQVFSDWASIGVTDGNLHLDSYNGKTVYINFYSNSNSQGLYVGGSILTTGGLTMYSDSRKKTILNYVELSLRQVANAPLIEHYYNSDQNKTTHVGSIAQYWAGLNDWFCKLDNEGYYTMEIQNAALASAISVARELVKFETETDRRIRLLEEENEQLKKEIEILKWNIA